MKTNAELRSHAKIHKEVPSYVCDICSKSFSTKNNLDQHQVNLISNIYLKKTCDNIPFFLHILKRIMILRNEEKGFILDKNRIGHTYPNFLSNFV